MAKKRDIHIKEEINIEIGRTFFFFSLSFEIGENCFLN